MFKRLLLYGHIAAIISCVLMGNVSLALADEEVLKISLKDAINMAVRTSENIKIRSNDILRKEAAYKKQKSRYYPHVYGAATWYRNFKYPDIPATALYEDYYADIGGSLDQKIFTFGKISSSVEAARNQIEVSTWSKEAVNHEIIYLTKLAYYNVCLAKRTLEIAKESYHRAEENKTILEDRSASGRASRYDNIKVAADIASRIPAVNNAVANLNSSLETLKRMIGAGANIDIDITDHFTTGYDLVDKQELIKAMQRNEPSLKAHKKSIDVKESIVKEKMAEFLPDISAFGTLDKKGAGGEYDVGNGNLYTYGAAGLKVSLPLWEGGRRVQELKEARIDKENAVLNLEKVNKDLLLELDTAIVVYNEFVGTLDSYEDAVRLAEQSFKLSQDMFHSGHISVTDLNDAELLLTREKLNREKTLFNISTTLAKIEKLVIKGAVSE